MFGAPQSVHFIGICGTAMASTAAAMHERGFHVTGSDQNIYPPMSTFLAGRQIPVMSGFQEENLAHRPDLIVVGNAISRGNPEVEFMLANKLRYISLPELLKEFFIRGRRSIVVAGTHGKTTTAALLAWVFEQSGRHPSYLIGGIPANLGQGARFTESEWFIIEGDEYDTAFFDKRSKFVHCPVRRFGFSEQNEVRIQKADLTPGSSRFRVADGEFEIGLIGELNVRNALAVVACARHCGLTDDAIQSAFSTFQGIKRRLEVRGTVQEVTVVDDFGHHPTAIRETLRALRVKFPGRRLWAIFEPRSNTTRRNIFQSELAEALGSADAVVVSEVARLELLPAAERLDPDRLLRELHGLGRPAAYLSTVEQIVEHVTGESRPGDVLCVFSNGGFGGIHDRLLDALKHRSSLAEMTAS
jgi:UDP-N-acetylmuramate: L-alanyl-gamma-D-glutamyl-meso-diaminopimelate ligase